MKELHHAPKAILLGTGVCLLIVVLEYARTACLVSMLYWSGTHRLTSRLSSMFKGTRHKHRFGEFFAELLLILIYSRLMTQVLCACILSNLVVTTHTIIRKNLLHSEMTDRIKVAGKLYQVTYALYSPAQLHLWCIKLVRHGPTKGNLLAMLNAYRISKDVLLGGMPREPDRIVWYMLVCIFVAYVTYMAQCMYLMALSFYDGPCLLGLVLFVHTARKRAKHKMSIK